MVSVGSLPVTGQQIFDLDTQGGVMHVLASVRASDISAEHKSELRDLVFLYTNGGKDSSVRTVLEQKLTAFGVTALPQKAKEAPKKEEPPQPTIGKFRHAPSFRVSVTSAAAPVASTPIPPPPPAPEPVRSTPPPAPVVEEPLPVPPPPPVYEPPQPPAPVPFTTQIVDEPVAVSPVVDVPPVSIPVATVAHPVDDKQYLDRIREIKASVNERVGNPVNLVDINNEVGREYMGAILDAMKKLNSGTSAGSAMKRLEEAYAAVLRTLEQRDAGVAVPVASTPIPPPPPAPEPVRSTPPPAPVVEEPLPVPPPPPVYEPPQPPAPVPFTTQIVDEPEPVFVPISSSRYVTDVEEELEPIAPEPAPQHSFEPLAAASSDIPPFEPLSGGSKRGKLTIEDATEVVSPPIPVAPVPPPPPPPPPSAPEPVSAWEAPQLPPSASFVPLSDVPEKPLSIDELPTSESLKSAATAGDPLFTKDVDDGLNQLLSEWSIFKKSGIFGTGPKGKEHPLFKKMAPLNIPLILAGRFEGATQEIKQSVTDYMNGWRYEQGLIYQQNETFEHYLRRVIKHILDLQKR